MRMPIKFVVMGVACVAASAVPGSVALAAGGYGPTAPTGPTNAPGGYTTISQVATVTSSGGSLNTPVVGGTAVVQAPEGAFSTPVQIEITTPVMDQVTAALPNLGFTGYTGVAALGVKVLDSNGQPLTGDFAKPLTVTLTGSGLGVTGEKVLEIDGSNSAHALAATVGKGSVTFEIPTDPDLVVVNPAVATTTNPVGATSVHTGKPLTAETGGALGAIGLGIGLALLAVRRRNRIAR